MDEKKIEDIKKSATYQLYIKKGISEKRAVEMILEVEKDFHEGNYKILA